MESRKFKSTAALLVLISLLLGSFSPAIAFQDRPEQPQPILLRLKYATFDPLQGEPAMTADLHLDAYAPGEQGAYIVQFKGPVLEAWKEAIHELGGQVLEYLPDYAFVVWMDEAIREKVESLDTVRWVGIYQPAYKISPNLAGERPVYRVVLFEPAARAAVEGRLQDLSLATGELQGGQVAIALPEGGAAVETMAAWPEVAWIESYPEYQTYNDVAAGIMGALTPWANGYTGSGMMVTVADTGIDSGIDNNAVPGDIHPDFDNRVAHISSWPVGIDPCYTNSGADDTAKDVSSGHGSHVIGSVGGNGSASAGQFKGLAYQATLTFQAVEQWTTIATLCGGGGGYYLSGIPLDLHNLFQEAYGWGSRIHSNSWGSNVAGEYTFDSRSVDDFMWQNPDMLILFSAGNEGTDGDRDGYVDLDSIGSPATAKNALTVGASDNERSTGGISTYTWYQAWPFDFPINPTRDDLTSDDRGELAAFSSRGPTDDGRLKPDIVAPGTNILSVRSQYATGSGWGPYNSYYMYMGGTSMATPLVAGAATLVREYYVEGQAHTPSAALIKATMINSATDITGYGNPIREAGLAIPNNHEGWGRVNVGTATSGSRRFDDGDTVTTGSNQTYNYQIGLASTPFKVTLVWTDYPASVGANPALVNNLNLVVTAPGGAVYRGNNFSGGWSTTGGTADTTNNVESVYVPNPGVGQWSVRVEGANVPQGPQPFALVVTGYFGPPPVYDNTLYLPLLFRKQGTVAPPSQIRNGDFEAGAADWTEFSALGYDLVVNADVLAVAGVTPHSGSQAAWLGGDLGEVSSIEQQVTVSASEPYLHYWHWIKSQDYCGFDDVYIKINGAIKESYSLCASNSTSNWVEHSVDLGTYAGQDIALQIRVETDGSLNSSLFVDDLSFQAGPAAIQEGNVGLPEPDAVKPRLDEGSRQ